MNIPSGRDFPMFGIALSHFASPNASPDNGLDLFIHTDDQSDLPTKCAQEILSLFFLTVASGVEKVGGTTRHDPALDRRAASREPSRRRPSAWTNSVFDMLATEAVEAGLVRDLTEAL
ncbi:hypothetical protein B0T22DRAFT_483833 [Podospora appendiculata]|uniref:Uncharacterized protein n=1 Tax=Podospora appendiculata TaxID=314037 RepID=A0AAE0X3V3_9PEZI|nr:hypothetical protein B0T22DRAFT_483833 [Podospora appendiculata]